MHFKNINKTYLAIIFFAAALILLSIPLVRVLDSNPAIPGNEHYEQITNQSSIWPILLGFIPQFILALSFPLLLAIASLLVFTVLISRHITHEHELYYALIILVLTPAFLGLHIGLSNYQFILFLGLLFALLYDMKTKWYFAPLGLLYLLDPLLAGVINLVMMIKSSIEDKGKDALSFAFFLIGMLVFSSFFSGITFDLSNVGFSMNSLFSFFNAKYGYSLFLVVLGFGGLFFEKNRNFPLIIIMASLFYEPLRLLGIAMLAYYSAKSFHLLQERKWIIPFIGNLTLVLFVCIFFFGSSTYIKETIQDKPYEEHVDALLFLREFGAQAKILTNSDLIEFSTFMTGQEAVYKPKYFESQQYRYISQEFKNEDIGYILIDKSMTSGKIWQHDEEGLLFLLKYNDDFKKIYETDDVQIYYFAPWRE